jgi:CBS domain-containing protein
MSVSQILSAKGRNVITASATDNVASIVKTLADKRIGAVVVIDEKGRIAGIVSERDVVRQLAREGAALLAATVSTIMTEDVKTCSETDDEHDLVSLMTENRIRHLPVVSKGKLAGMISIGDVVKHRMETLEHETEELRAYISGAA